METSPISNERRRHCRFLLDLPLEFREMDFPDAAGGIAINGSEHGLLIQASKEMTIGSKLAIWVLFPNEFELSFFEAVVQIVRQDPWRKGQSGHRYGVKLIHINPHDRMKLLHLLSTQASIAKARQIEHEASNLL